MIDVILTPLTNSIIFQDGEIAPPTNQFILSQFMSAPKHTLSETSMIRGKPWVDLPTTGAIMGREWFSWGKPWLLAIFKWLEYDGICCLGFFFSVIDYIKTQTLQFSLTWIWKVYHL
jgi:hypothetical protein